MNHSIAAGKLNMNSSSIFQGNAPMNSFNRIQTDFERDGSAVNYNDIFQKKITSTSNQKSQVLSNNSPFIKKSSFRPENMGSMHQSQMQTSVMAPKVILEEEFAEVVLEYVKIGDIVCIEFNEQVFDGLKEYAKLDEGRDNLRLAKIIEKPDFTYKGLLYSDGIVEKDLKLTASDSLKDQNKATFRIEVVQDYKFTKQFNELKNEIMSMEIGEFENPEEEKDKRHIFQDVSKKFSKEVKGNINEMRYSSGKKLLYGQTIQFRHVASNLFLTLDMNKLSSEFG